jgi:uncharacterized protein (DUF1697 family)
MPRLIAFLRAINVGGHTVTMARLRGEFEALGFTDVETFIASGNVIFSARRADDAALARKIEARLRASLGYEVATFVRTGAEVTAAASFKPFDDDRVKTARAFCVGFLDRPLDAAAKRALRTFETDIDEFRANGREIYWLCQKGQGESTFSNAKFEKVVKVRATFRGINTVMRLSKKYGTS